MTLDVAKKIQLVYGARKINFHESEEDVSSYSTNNSKFMIVFDQKLTCQILTSKCFKSTNYFRSGMDRFRDSNFQYDVYSKFWNENLLFVEGVSHKNIKLQMQKRLDSLSDFLVSNHEYLHRYFCKKFSRYSSSLDFSVQFTNLVFGLLINHLTGISIKKIYRTLLRRTNIFYSYFHAPRHKKMAILFEDLFAPKNLKSNIDAIDLLIAKSLIVMGADPLIASICAGIEFVNKRSFVITAQEISPVSFVSRVCVVDFEHENKKFKSGDVVFLSLLPSRNNLLDPNNQALNNSSFGFGVHKCIGKSISFDLLSLAEEIFKRNYHEEFTRRVEVVPDGSFLAFKNA